MKSQNLSPLYEMTEHLPTASSPFNSFGAKFQTTFVVCFFYSNKPSLGKTFICKVERLNVKQRRSR